MNAAFEDRFLIGSSPLRRAGVVLMLVTLLSRTFGYLREAVIAAAFGASREVDIYLTAITIPAVIMTTVYYSIPNAFIPLWGRSDRHSVSLRRSIIIIVVLAAALALLVDSAARPLMALLAGGYSPEAGQRATELLRVSAWIVFFAVIEALLRSRLLALKRFGLPTLSYVWQGIGVIVAVIGWPQQGARAMVWGLLVGTAASALWDAILLLSIPATHPAMPDSAPPVRDSPSRVWTWIVLIFLTDSLSQVYVVVDRLLGSYLDSGAIAALNYASLVVGVSTAIIATTLSTAIFPFLSDAHVEQNQRRTFEIIDRAVTWSIILAIPTAVWTLAFSGPITSVLFERGAFNTEARRLTSHVLAAYSLSVMPIALAAVWARLFYAARRWKPILASSLVSLAVKCGCAVWWVSKWGIVGLALSGVAAPTAAAAFMGWHERGTLREGVRRWAGLACKVLLLVCLPAIPCAWLVSRVPETDFLSPVLLTLGGVLAGVALLVGAGRRWGIAEMQSILDLLVRRRRSET
jgi:putative peptidoglycan lipid II flippase